MGLDKNNFSHCWLAIIAVVVMFNVFAISLLPESSNNVLLFMALLVNAAIYALALQGTNEAIQFLGDVENTYGSLRNAQNNSKEDWRWFIIGVFVGWVICGAELFFI